jgi:hypothetical protein
MWDLVWTKQHWDRFLSGYCGFSLSLSRSILICIQLPSTPCNISKWQGRQPTFLSSRLLHLSAVHSVSSSMISAPSCKRLELRDTLFMITLMLIQSQQRSSKVRYVTRHTVTTAHVYTPKKWITYSDLVCFVTAGIMYIILSCLFFYSNMSITFICWCCN